MNASTEQPSLLKALLASLRGVGFAVALLALLTLLSALAVVWSAYQTRMARAELEALEKQRDDLDNDYRALKLGQAALAEHGRVEAVATKKLGMERVGIANERVVQP